MILLDFSGAIYAGVYVDVAENKDTSKEFLRALLVSQIRSINRRFKDKYGELVICLDSGNCWRKDIFPHYKAGRAAAKKASPIDWDTVWKNVNEIIAELKENLPYKFVKVERAEADDIIATLALKYAEEEPVVIVSNDKDFKQLHNLPNLKQWFNQKQVFDTEPDAELYLFEHICRGDAVDGIPNIRSDEDTFINEGKRQKPVTNKFIAECKLRGIPTEYQRAFHINRALVDLRKIPEKIKDAIFEEFENTTALGRNKLMVYLVENNLVVNLDKILDF